MQCTILLLFANGGVVVLPVIVFAVLFHIRMYEQSYCIMVPVFVFAFVFCGMDLCTSAKMSSSVQ